MQSEKKVTSSEIRFTAVGGTYSEPTFEKPHVDWISNKLWCGVCELSDTFECFKGLKEGFIR